MHRMTIEVSAAEDPGPFRERVISKSVTTLENDLGREGFEVWVHDHPRPNHWILHITCK